MAQTTARALVDHWAWASGKGELTAGTARALATACRGVLEVQEDWENLDVRTLDVESSFNKFKNLRSRSFKPRSLREYESRFRRAVASYLEFLDDPSTWKFPLRATTSRRSNSTERSRGSDRSTEFSQPDHASESSSPPGVLQEYPYPIRPDVLARLTIPRDATTAEINRLVAWARTLATDYEPSS